MTSAVIENKTFVIIIINLCKIPLNNHELGPI